MTHESNGFDRESSFEFETTRWCEHITHTRADKRDGLTLISSMRQLLDHYDSGTLSKGEVREHIESLVNKRKSAAEIFAEYGQELGCVFREVIRDATGIDLDSLFLLEIVCRVEKLVLERERAEGEACEPCQASKALPVDIHVRHDGQQLHVKPSDLHISVGEPGAS